MERPDLAPYAARSNQSRGRRYREDFRDDRSAFVRDRDRIIHCAAFRRLEYKTQVFVNHEGDYYRTRLTHSLEVAQIARGIARRLFLNEDLVEALALAHDLGHTPFGHTGEDVLDRLMEGFGGFEHNRQSLRIVEYLEERYPDFYGLNLTWETREGIIKHSDISSHSMHEAQEYQPHVPPTLEAQIIDLADEIAYNNHDIDDGLKAGYITLAELHEVPLWSAAFTSIERQFPSLEPSRHIYQTISTLIGQLIEDVVATTSANIAARGIRSIEDVRRQNDRMVCFSSAVRTQNKILKQFLRERLYRHHKVERMRVKVERILSMIFESYLKTPSLLPAEYHARFEIHGKERAICDLVAGMTDRYALDEYKKLFEPYEPV
ncbi:deoxyguanosine triphosphate triphosphohydrolase, putative [Syntrophotalea carbinolica DSM 2380]|uniref:Deoxyguanosinetriphosphate triphosphohydrolase-like protein n=1 Tax=Syntrophotalea carbinolica (strain DSM 2380 / NBRC 103641 / GraBd1) TaxID=338963 RepID=Q3A425_SYNC1|nr:deoxyguanosinetriphosphate triphosphohydrolase [Syntrophotalea carbinolica]ABA88882.1 deoxyguanosine triphosphate triphosphohydrolase, putative [Syntrophotalea carbinolica DSM 2380]